MPGLRFAEVHTLISLAEVLEVVQFVPCERSRDQVRGPCPVHHPDRPGSRSFSENLRRNVYQCFHCGSSGNQFDLYAAVTGLPLFAAAVALCEPAPRGALDQSADTRRCPDGSAQVAANHVHRHPLSWESASPGNHPGGSILAAKMAHSPTAINTGSRKLGN